MSEDDILQKVIKKRRCLLRGRHDKSWHFHSQQLFYNNGFDLCMAGFIKPKLFTSRFAQIEHTLLGIRPAVIHTHNNRSTRLYARHLELCAKRERPMGTSKVVAIKNLATRGFFAIKPLTVITCISRKGIANFSFFLDTRRFRHASVPLAVCGTGTSRNCHQNAKKNSNKKSRMHKPIQSRTCCCTYFREFRLPC